MTWIHDLLLCLAAPAAVELACLILWLLRGVLERRMAMGRLDRALRRFVLSSLLAAPILAALLLPRRSGGSALYLWSLFVLWLAGAVYVGLIRVLSEERLLRRVERMSRVCRDGELLDIKEGMAAWLDVKARVPVYTGSLIPTPYTRGIFKKRIYISEASCTEDEWKLLLTHELIHCRRGDCLYRRLLLALRAILWFCPNVRRLAGYAIEVNELACDDEVIRQRPRGARAPYGGLIIRMRENMSGLCGAFLGGGEDSLERRIRHLTRPNRESHAALAAALSAAVSLLPAAATAAVALLMHQYF